MLAQNFKSADELGITHAEQQALIKVLGMLERRELIQVPEDMHCDNGFNMGTQGRGCGTPACIGGWVAHLLGMNQKIYVDRYEAYSSAGLSGLSDLYWNQCAIWCETTDHAATALRSYLTTGEANWEQALNISR